MSHHPSYNLTGHISIDVYRAARANDTPTVKRLIEEYIHFGGNIESCFMPNHRDEVWFELWASTGNEFLLDLLQSFGIPWTPRSAVYWGRLDVLTALVNERSSALKQRDRQQRTLMYHALAASHGHIAGWLLDRGMSLASCEEQYVFAATRSRDERMIRFAVAHGAPVDGCPQGRTPLHHECNHGWSRLVPCLLELGADPNARDPIHHGRAALHLAVQRKNTAQLVNLLIAAGADPNAIDHNGEQPIDIARKIKAVRLVNILNSF